MHVSYMLFMLTCLYYKKHVIYCDSRGLKLCCEFILDRNCDKAWFCCNTW